MGDTPKAPSKIQETATPSDNWLHASVGPILALAHIA
jgi:hypothetical protein